VAQKLHDTYGFKYDDASGKPLLRVLLGGWNTWKQENAKDPNGYPTEVTEGAETSTPSTQGDNGNPIQLVTTSVAQPQAGSANAPASNSNASNAAPPPGLVPIPGKTP
jgi:hypothetical protein